MHSVLREQVRVEIQDMNVLPDIRVPENICLGIAPWYTTYHDMYETVMRLRKIVREKVYEKYSSKAPIVT